MEQRTRRASGREKFSIVFTLWWLYPSRLEFRDHKLMKLPRSSRDVYEPSVCHFCAVVYPDFLDYLRVYDARLTTLTARQSSLMRMRLIEDYFPWEYVPCVTIQVTYKEIHTSVLLNVDEF